MKIDFVNMPNGSNKLTFLLRYIFNLLRTWFLFRIKYHWVKYEGFVRVMSGTTFARKEIRLGNNVQFGQYCHIDTNVQVGNDVLFAGRVCLIEKYGHTFDEPCVTIWDSPSGVEEFVLIEDDVWIGDGSLILSGASIGSGSIIAAHSVVTGRIPPCEIWGGVPAKKIKDRFEQKEQKEMHIQYLKSLKICE